MGSFFVFPYPPFQFLNLVIIGRWISAGIPHPKLVIFQAIDIYFAPKPSKSPFHFVVEVLCQRIDAQTASHGCRLFTKRALGAKVFV